MPSATLAPELQIRDQGWFVSLVGDLISKPVCRRTWVLGAGASKESGVPLAAELAWEWLSQIVGIPAETKESEDQIIAAGAKLGIGKDLAAQYFSIYEKRFFADRRAGFFSLIEHINGKSPSYGYFVLAALMNRCTSKIAITVNFDNLLANALQYVTNQYVQVIGHERIAHCVLCDWNLPVVCKVHRDLTMQPLNTAAEMETLDAEWVKALTQIFGTYSPVFIGYGGNDHTLMGFLERLPKGAFPAPPIWLEYVPPSASEPVTSTLPPKVQAFLRRHEGIVVHYEGFDSLFAAIKAHHMKDFSLAQILEVYTNHIKGVSTESMQQASEAVSATWDGQSTLDEIEKNPTKTLEDYLTLAQAKTKPEDRISVLRAGLEDFLRRGPEANHLAISRLYNNLGHNLYVLRKFENAIPYFTKAIENNADYAKAYYNRSCCKVLMKDAEAGLDDLQSAIRLDPSRRVKALQDEDFEALRESPRFQALVAEPQSL